MRWRPSINLGTWAGVELRLDLVMVILIALLFFQSLNNADQSTSYTSAFAHLALLVIMLFCMFLHELGHAFAAKLRGHTPTMIFLSFVGLTFFEAKDAKPSDEFWIAIAGPMVNIVIAVATVTFLGLAIFDSPPNAPPFLSQQGMHYSFTYFVAWVSMLNIAVAVINLMPGWPADGARAMRGWLSKKWGYKAATVRAVSISNGLWMVLAGLSIILMVGSQAIKYFTDGDATRSRFQIILMYQMVFLVLAAMGLYYGWAEKRRVALAGDSAEEEVGPPSAFKPGRKKEEEPEEDDEEGPGAVDKAKQGAKDALDAGKLLYKAGKASGKSVGWMAKQGAKLAGEALKDKKKK
ncbi:MAG: site-2 protease family protein [Planctomycetota bacterium]|jgi:Zn-dependent protease